MNNDKRIEAIPPRKDDNNEYQRKYSLECNKNSKNGNSTLVVVGVGERFLKVFQNLGSLYCVIC